MSKFLIIQTAFTGDVVLATSIVEKLHQYYPDAKTDFLLRKGNEELLEGNPHINKVFIWDKKNRKNRNLLQMIVKIRKERYTHVINLHRFFTSGFITFLSGAAYKSGFDKNPFSFCYTKKIKHAISEPYSENVVHEIDRNHALITDITDRNVAMPALYPTQADYEKIKRLQTEPYICIGPASIWFTKQFPKEKWVELLNVLPAHYKILLLGGPGDAAFAGEIVQNTLNKKVQNLCGQLSFLQSAALMQNAEMNYVNDSAPLHFASATNAPVTAIFCSTVPAFGFGPLRDNGKIVEIKERLYCRPCGLHGHTACPEGHFRCAKEITNDQLLWWTSKTI